MLKKLLIVLVVVVVILVFLLAKDWDSPELGQSILAEVSEASGFDISAEGFRLNLLRGLFLESVKARSSSAGRTVDFSLDQLICEHRLLPLLTGTVSIDRIVLDRPQIELIESGAPTRSTADRKPVEEEAAAAGEEGAPSGAGGLSIAIREIAVRNGTILIRSETAGDGSRTTRIEGLDLLFEDISYPLDAERAILELQAGGDLGIRQVDFDELQVRDAEAEFRLSEGRFVLKPLSFVMDEGRFTADMQVDFNSTPFTYSLTAQGDPLDFNTMARAEEGFGPGTLQLEAEGVGTDSKDVKGEGSLALAEGEFPTIPALAQIDEKLGKTILVGAPYKATELRFRLADNVATLEPFPFETERAKMELRGWVNVKGPLGLQIAMGVPREGIVIEGVGGDVLDILADDDGWVLIPIAVTGTQENPRVRPDTGALLAQAAQGTKRLATEKATEAIKGLFRKKKK